MIDQRLVDKAIHHGAAMCAKLVAEHSKNGTTPCPHDFVVTIKGVGEAEVIVQVQVRAKP